MDRRELRDPAVRRIDPGVGMGDFLEYDQRYAQFKGQMPAKPDDVVFAPDKVAGLPAEHQWIRPFAEEMKAQLAAMLSYVLQKTPQKTYLPPWTSRPWFADLNQRYNKLPALAAGGAAAPWNDLLTFPVPPKHRIVVGGIGTDAECQTAFTELQWRFQLGGRTIPFLFDATIAGAQEGIFMVPLGTIAVPLNLMQYGMSPRYSAGADTSLVLQVRNIAAVNAHSPESLVLAYTYSMEKAAEFEDGDLSALCGGAHPTK